MVGILMPTEERKGGAEKAPRAKKENYSTFRCYTEQGEKLNELADLMPKGKQSVAEVLKVHLDGTINELLIKLTAEKLKRLKERKG